ncbi:LLM class flavin-dependent oxidoreductase [Paenibacillus sp. GCM10012307]|uniref:LLM class flavin-dependent oxidoreductase n=1 Tax=Paenibacillus roseus TaxID=2798579 RepID=A0A934J0D0_9BACL|nr:LLM class flavin-dependent oxidoreductase [Paenibacillus roseus]MBJ6362522.1 LLM class flavin-dependent oxidoreductase [Paenibacillus roseus]
MTTGNKMLHLNACSLGHDFGSVWRLPFTQPERSRDLNYLIELVQLAEKGKMDALFSADFYSVRDDVDSSPAPESEPLTLYSALAAATSHIGIVMSASTTYNDPYHLASTFASIDHLTEGRTGWNMVTTAVSSVAGNYSRSEHLDHDSRYELARKVVNQVRESWNRWEYPLPQKHPVAVQAGSSEAGKQFAAEYAEVIFAAQPLLAYAQNFYADVKTRVKRVGRNPDHVHILPGLVPIIAATHKEALELEQELNIYANLKNSTQAVSRLIDVDLTKLDPDIPIPHSILPQTSEVEGMRSRSQLVLDMIRDQNLTVRQLVSAGTHLRMVGSWNEVADQMTTWLEQRGADGFNVMFPYTPGGLEDVVEHLIPELQNRGIYRADYEGTTLRSHYQLPLPSDAALNR